MKKIYAIAAIVALLAGCAKEVKEIENPEQPDTQPVETVTESVFTLHAYVQDDTKVSADNAGAYAWQAGDKITVISSNEKPYEFTTTGNGTSVDFSSDSFDGDLTEAAMYPMSSGHTADIFALNSTISWVQDATMMPMWGTVNTASATASFAPVGAVLKLVCYNVGASAHRLVVSSDTKKIVGEFTPSGTPKVIATEDSASDNELTIEFMDEHPTNMVFYIPVPTGNLGHLTFTLQDGMYGELFTKTTKGEITAGRNQVLVAGGLNCAPVTVIFSEDFSSYAANAVPSGTVGGVTYTCTDGGSTTKIYDATLAGGVSPELLIGKNTGTFQVSGIPCSGISSMTLTFKKNDKPLTVTATEGITVSGATAGEGTKTLTLTNASSLTSFDLTFAAGSSNVRFDDVLLIDANVVAPTLPTLTPDDASLTIPVGLLTASTTVTYANKVDDLAPVATSNAAWLSAELTGSYPTYTLTVTATGANETAVPRVATVTLRASGVTTAVTVSQEGSIVKGTVENPYTASEALAATNALPANGTVADVYVYGLISQITTAYNDTYNNVSFNISNDGLTTGEQFLLFRVPATSAADYSVGDAVKFKGTLKNHNGNTPEMIAEFTEIYKYKAPQFSPAGGSYNEAQSVTLTADAGATIYYTLDGTTPTSASTPYTAALSISESTTVKAIAIKEGISTGVVTADYTIEIGNSNLVLVFDVSSNPGEWPTTNSADLTDYTYTLNAVDYTFKLKNVKQNSGYLMLTQPAALGLPAIANYKLIKIVARNSSGCSTSTKVGISTNYSCEISYTTGGAIQTWSTTNTDYTYNLSSTAANTVYYLYVTNKNCQLTSLTLTYEPVE